LSTSAGLRHVAVHLVAGLAGGYLVNKMFDKKSVGRDKQAPSEKAETKEKVVAQKNIETSIPLSPRQEQQVRIAQATTQQIQVKARGRKR
jgi:hypothetical protein